MDRAPPEGAAVEVTHCICTNTALASLTSGTYSTVAAVMAATQCGAYCGLCLPYIQNLLRLKV